jgi:hypothetical protein
MDTGDYFLVGKVVDYLLPSIAELKNGAVIFVLSPMYSCPGA